MNVYETKNIIKLISNFFENTNYNCNNLNIIGKWVSGKTTYLLKLKDELDNIGDYKVELMNVWEYEFTNNIFLAVLSDILSIFKYEPSSKVQIRNFMKNTFLKLLGMKSIDDEIQVNKDEDNLFKWRCVDTNGKFISC